MPTCVLAATHITESVSLQLKIDKNVQRAIALKCLNRTEQEMPGVLTLKGRKHLSLRIMTLQVYNHVSAILPPNITINSALREGECVSYMYIDVVLRVDTV